MKATPHHYMAMNSAAGSKSHMFFTIGPWMPMWGNPLKLLPRGWWGWSKKVDFCVLRSCNANSFLSRAHLWKTKSIHFQWPEIKGSNRKTLDNSWMDGDISLETREKYLVILMFGEAKWRTLPYLRMIRPICTDAYLAEKKIIKLSYSYPHN